jgi:PIN domain nuclease of toxin-antitoxin system
VILLDTQALIWWVNGQAELSVTALAQIEAERPGGRILASAISAWEVCVLEKRGRLGLRMETGAWLRAIEAVPEVAFVPVDHEIAAQAMSLPTPCPPAPVDRIIAATARKLGCVLVTADPQFWAYPHVRSVW